MPPRWLQHSLACCMARLRCFERSQGGIVRCITDGVRLKPGAGTHCFDKIGAQIGNM